jgi:PAS domain S-box-containing protein
MEAKKIIQSLRRRREFFPHFIFITGIIVTLAVALYLNGTSRRDDEDRFQSAATRTKESIISETDTYTALLRAGAGLFAGSEMVTKDEFKAFADSSQVYKRYKGVQGLVYATRILDSEKDQMTQELRDEGVTNFSIRPETPVRPEYFAIAYFEPLDMQNTYAVGFDVFTEPIRRRAMEKARDSGQPRATKKVILAEGDEYARQPGFIIYVPVYKKGSPQGTLAERRENIDGFIYSPFRAQDFLSNIYDAEHSEDIRLAAYNGDTTDENMLFESKKLEGALKKHTPQYSTTIPLEVAGEKWTLAFTSLPEFEKGSEISFIPYILFIGVLVSAVLFYITKLQIKARQEAISLAEDLLFSEIALRESNRQKTNIVESITDGFITLDRHWLFTYVNPEAAKTFGKRSRDLIRKNIWEVFPEIRDTVFGRTLERSMRERRKFELEEYYEPAKAWLSIRLYPSRTGLSVYFQNITVRKRLERQKDEFLGIASHELKTPVTSLKSYAQVLYRRFVKKGDAEAAGHLVKMDNQLDRLTLLISDLLDVTKIEAGKMIFNETSFDLDALVREIAEELERTTDQHKINVKGSIEREAFGDKERIGQVLSNLISNAIKYSPAANKIWITLSENKKEATVCVKDFGVGIPQNTVNKVFERFFRVSGPKQETFPGLGLGLYISSEIIKRQGGRIWVESELGKGSNFCFSVPFVIKKSKENK